MSRSRSLTSEIIRVCASSLDTCRDTRYERVVLADTGEVASTAARDVRDRTGACQLVSKFVLMALLLLGSMGKHTAQAGNADKSGV